MVSKIGCALIGTVPPEMVLVFPDTLTYEVNPCGAVIFVVPHTPLLQVCDVSQMAIEDEPEPVIVQLHWVPVLLIQGWTVPPDVHFTICW